MLLAVTVVPAVAQVTGSTTTLTDILREHGFEAGRKLSPDLLTMRINGFTVDADEHEFICAFQEISDERSPAKSHIVLFVRASGRWLHRDISAAVRPANAITGIKKTLRYIYLDSHINPSAGRLVILSRNLRSVRQLDGWALAVLPNDSVVLHHNQVHFAPTHSLEVSLFDPRSGRQKQIYPPKIVDAVRRDFVRRVAQEYKQRGEQWFADHNHHMNPELFDSALVGDAVVDSAGDSVRFRVRFGDPQNGNDPLSFSEQVAVDCSSIGSLDKATCHERKE
jgi:hypothetical protein